MRGTRWYARDRNSLTRSTLLIFRRGQPPVAPPLITRIKKARRWPVLGLGLSRCIPAQCLASLARTDRLLTGSSMHGAELAGGDRALWSRVLVGCILLTLGMLMPDAGRATCGQKCDLSYSADIDDCRFQYGNDPADADALADCIQEAKVRTALVIAPIQRSRRRAGGGWRGAPSSCGAAGQRNRARLTGC